MILTVSFKVKNFVEVMESWPIEAQGMTFFLEREENVVKAISVSFKEVPVSLAPKINKAAPGDVSGTSSTITMNSADYVDRARRSVLNWQAVVSGQQIFDLDFDNFETRYRAETVEEEDQIHLNSFSRSGKSALNSECDFEQIGRAFCVGPIGDARIESTSHYREGRIALEAGRFVDAYNNLFLFLETRYCDGKTKTAEQVNLLAGTDVFVQALEACIAEQKAHKLAASQHLTDIFSDELDLKQKIRKIVLLRGKLRHHSTKNPNRWNPNKQGEYEDAARFLNIVVGGIVLEESIADIYSPPALKSFKDISTSMGFETAIELRTHRLENKPTLQLDMTIPTTVISSKLCMVTVRNALSECDRVGQLADTVKLEAVLAHNQLQLLALELGTWAHSVTRTLKPTQPLEAMRCSFEHCRHGLIVRDEFSFPVNAPILNIPFVWRLVSYCFDHIENADPTTRIMNLKLFLNKGTRPILEYRVGAQVEN